MSAPFKDWKKLKGGEAFIGMTVISPDGLGRVSKILNPDNVMIEYEGKKRFDVKLGKDVSIVGLFDLSELRADPEQKAPAAPKEKDTPDTPIIAASKPAGTPEGAVA